MTKGKQMTQEINLLKKRHRKVCKMKIRYGDIQTAWEHVANHYKEGRKFQTPYECRAYGGGHYHLTSHASKGDLSHIPPEYRYLFEVKKDILFIRIKKWIHEKTA